MSAHPSQHSSVEYEDYLDAESVTTGINYFEHEFKEDHPMPKKPTRANGESMKSWSDRVKSYNEKLKAWHKMLHREWVAEKVRDHLTEAQFNERMKELLPGILAKREKDRLQAKFNNLKEAQRELIKLAANEAATQAQFKTAAGKELAAAKETENALRKAKAEATKSKAKLEQAEKDKVDAEKLKGTTRGQRLAARTAKKGQGRRRRTHRKK